MRALPVLLWTFLTIPLFAQLPEGFSDEAITGGWTLPAGITFDENGQGYIWGSYGVVYVMDTAGVVQPSPLLDLREEVGRWLDHGMLGFTLDPNFLENGHLYLLYTVDRHHLLHFGAPDYDPNVTVTHEATIGRITRYTADPAQGYRSIVPGSRKVLVGKNPADGFPILFDAHGLGALVFGSDGSLLASCGESGSSVSTDNGHDNHTDYAQALADGILRPEENVGAFRSQLIDNLNGKIIRVDPATGDGLPGNPFFDPEASRAARSRIYTLGLRNPFRFTRIPGTGSHELTEGYPGNLLVSDVGDKTWEELNLVTGPGQNFGWPLYEGFEAHPIYHNLETYNGDAPNTLTGNDCPSAFYTFQELLLHTNDTLAIHPCDPTRRLDSLTTVFQHQPPVLAYQNQGENTVPFTWVRTTDTEGRVSAVPINSAGSPIFGSPFQGDAGTGGVVYQGDQFPERYRGRFFLADFKDWIRVFELDEQKNLIGVEDFHTDTREVVSLAVSPHDGSLYYTSMKDKKLHRIHYGGPTPPVARAEADRSFGPSPLTVQLNAAASYSQQSPLSFFWDFGDGQTSTEISPTHTFEAPGPTTFAITLMVRDTFGVERSADLSVSVNNTPPQVQLLSPAANARYPLDVTSLIRLAAEVSDKESPTAQLTYDWQLFLHHNTHFHPASESPEPTAYALLSPLGCGSESYWYRVALTVTDPHGLSTTTEHLIFPDCDGDWRLGELAAEVSASKIDLRWPATDLPAGTRLEIQRSEDYYHFEKVGGMAGDRSDGDYHFMETNPHRGLHLYRIEATAPDGGFRHSNVVAVSFPPPTAVWIFPNPAREKFTIEVLEAASSLLRFSLFSDDGRQVRTFQWAATPGEPFRREIDTRLLSEGLYFFILVDGSQEQSGRIQVMH